MNAPLLNLTYLSIKQGVWADFSFYIKNKNLLLHQKVNGNFTILHIAIIFIVFLIIIFLSFEKAARGGGVYPDVMFEVAKHWYELYNKNLPAGNAMATPPPGNLLKDIDNKTVRRSCL